jgi:hypothetical protein
MQDSSRLRLWFWLTVVPAGAIFVLTILLRQSAEIAADKRLEQAYAERRASDEQAQREREATRIAVQQAAAERCARLARGMLEVRSDDALLIMVTNNYCGEQCSLIDSANRLTAQYAGLGLRGLWVATSQSLQGRPPAPSAMQRLVVPDCSAFLGHRDSDFIVFGRDGRVVHHGLAASAPTLGRQSENEATLLAAIPAR